MQSQVIVTRPAVEAGVWLDGLRAAGLQATNLPLIETRALARPWPVLGAAAAQIDPAALMFVSAAAVRHFFADDGAGQAFGGHPALCAGLRAGRLRAWVTGPGSAQALLQAGVPQAALDAPTQDAAELDSEALWAVVSPQVCDGFRVLIVRGRDAQGGDLGRSWLAGQAALSGAEIAQCVAYERARPPWTDAQSALARASAIDGSIWLFSSSQAVAHLEALAPGQSWRAARALATHPRIAHAARGAGFGAVAQTKPSLSAVLASIESFDESGDRAAPT